jgi:hypothetical protein
MILFSNALLIASTLILCNVQPMQDPPLCNSTGNIVTFVYVDEHKGRVSIVQFNCDLYTVHRNSHLVSHNLCNLL